MKLHNFYIIVTILSTLTLICNAEDIQIFLDRHNVARAQVGVTPLSWNESLATFALTYANKLKAGCNYYEIPSGSPYGENIAGGYGAFTAEEAVYQWVEEKKNYIHETNSCKPGSNCGRYTQVVWRNSVGLGCASILCGAGWPFVVCEYYPKGNIPGQSPY